MRYPSAAVSIESSDELPKSRNRDVLLEAGAALRPAPPGRGEARARRRARRSARVGVRHIRRPAGRAARRSGRQHQRRARIARQADHRHPTASAKSGLAPARPKAAWRPDPGLAQRGDRGGGLRRARLPRIPPTPPAVHDAKRRSAGRASASPSSGTMPANGLATASGRAAGRARWRRAPGRGRGCRVWRQPRRRSRPPPRAGVLEHQLGDAGRRQHPDVVSAQRPAGAGDRPFPPRRPRRRRPPRARAPGRSTSISSEVAARVFDHDHRVGPGGSGAPVSPPRCPPVPFLARPSAPPARSRSSAFPGRAVGVGRAHGEAVDRGAREPGQGMRRDDRLGRIRPRAASRPTLSSALRRAGRKPASASETGRTSKNSRGPEGRRCPRSDTLNRRARATPAPPQAPAPSADEDAPRSRRGAARARSPPDPEPPGRARRWRSGASSSRAR